MYSIASRSATIVAFTVLASAGIAFAQTSTTTSSGSPSLGVTLTATERVAPGTEDALMALVIMTTGTGGAVQTSSLPLSVTFGNGLEPADVSDCRVRDVMSLATPLNASAVALTNGSNTFSFPTLTVENDSTVTLAVTCDIADDTPLAGTAMVSITPSAVPATASGTSITPTTGPNLSGGTGATSGTVTISSTPSTPPPFIPGVPNTGSGMMNLLLLAASGAVIAAGAAMLLRRRV